ncbi:hypothetical protein ILFOPFJJ_02394 [Ensifer psoraleae]|nr:hypothetical protein [Sinorhizobium psoraleae]
MLPCNNNYRGPGDFRALTIFILTYPCYEPSPTSKTSFEVTRWTNR